MEPSHYAAIFAIYFFTFILYSFLIAVPFRKFFDDAWYGYPKSTFLGCFAAITTSTCLVVVYPFMHFAFAIALPVIWFVFGKSGYFRPGDCGYGSPSYALKPVKRDWGHYLCICILWIFLYYVRHAAG